MLLSCSITRSQVDQEPHEDTKEKEILSFQSLQWAYSSTCRDLVLVLVKAAGRWQYLSAMLCGNRDRDSKYCNFHFSVTGTSLG